MLYNADPVFLCHLSSNTNIQVHNPHATVGLTQAYHFLIIEPIITLTLVHHRILLDVLFLLQLMQVVFVHMEMFVWWEAPISMRVEWRCASMTSGELCVMTSGTILMLLWSASSLDMHTLEVSTFICN